MDLNVVPLSDAGNYGGPTQGANPYAAQARLNTEVSQLAPLATTFHTPAAQSSVPFNSSGASSGSGISKFAHFIGGVAGEIGHITAGVTKWLGSQVVNMAEAPLKLGTGISHGWLDRMDLTQINAQNTQNSDKLNTLISQYKTGKISGTDYKLGLKELNQSMNDLALQSQGVDNRLKADQSQTIQAGVNTAADLITILTAGFGKVGSATLTADGVMPATTKTAADFLASTNANAFLTTVEQGISHLATNPEAFAKLSPIAQKAIQGSTAEVLSQAGARLTSGQIARASAVNLALKYPIYYQMLSSSGQQIYNELDNKKYGSAVRTIAFNAALLLSGGPIGKALSGLGKVVGGTSNAIFGKTAFLDELSKGIGNGTPDGLFNAINKLPASERADVIKQMSAVESTNLAAAGNDPVAAAWRVLNGMQSYEGASMDTFSHEEALNNMVNFAKAQRLADETAKNLGMNPVTVGRVDARALNEISAKLSPSADRLATWEQLKTQNPTQAWANNENIDKQIKHLISQHQDAGLLDNAIRGIKASFNVSGFPKSVSMKLAKMGYIPISPRNLEAPFVEGAGKLGSKFAENTDFFTKTIQPLPVLGHLGDMLTSMGLSPQASAQRVYEVFNQNFSEALQGTRAFGTLKLAGDSNAQSADTIIKRLSDYSHDLSGRKFPLKAPITDLRQLTVSDVSTALDIPSSQAREIQSAIMDSMIKVPLAIRGLGDRIVDVNYKVNPLAGVYARLQGALRFSWNPFFQVKLATKTEFLSQLEAGGKLPPIGGLASVFSKDYQNLDNIRTTLRAQGIFEESSHFAVGGEAVADGSAVGPNLTHRLLPIQEKSIAGLIKTQADKVGMDVESFVKAFPQETRDTVQMIAQYDRRSQLLNSPLMRTLNLAFFPLRFETKVAMITARALAKTSPMTQMAVIKGLYNGSNWLKSPEGQAWYSKNAEVIGMFKYFSPLATISTIANVLGTHGESIGAYGELGGLPFGWIPTLLDAEGLTHFGQSYVNPKTGAVALDYVPATSRGQLQTAISDLLGSLFSYPGTTVGLPSKGTVTRYAATAITGGKSKSDFTTSTPAITPEQQGFQQVVQSQNNTQPTSPQPTPTSPAIKVPSEPSPVTIPRIKSTSSGSRKKKSQYTPALLPGQSQLGQL